MIGNKVNFAETIKAAEKEGLVGGGDTFKAVEGGNRIRLLEQPLPHPGFYKGTPNFKWFTRVLDRTDGHIKIYFMPNVIFKLIRDLQESDDYGFDDVPLPYDITINAIHAGTKEVEYSVVPARKNTPLTGDELNAIDALKPLKEVQAAIKAKTEQTEPLSRFDPEEKDEDRRKEIPY